MRGVLLHQLHGGGLGVDVGRVASGKELHGDCGEACGDAAGGGEAGVVGRAGAEQDFVCGVVLLKKGGEMGFEVGLVAVEGFEKGERRGECGLASRELR